MIIKCDSYIVISDMCFVLLVKFSYG